MGIDLFRFYEVGYMVIVVDVAGMEASVGTFVVDARDEVGFGLFVRGVYRADGYYFIDDF